MDGSVGIKTLSLGNRIRLLRTSKRVGQKELANLAGISNRQLCTIECGKTLGPRLDTLRRIACALGVDVSVLVEGAD